jgi:hypothetical protein
MRARCPGRAEGTTGGAQSKLNAVVGFPHRPLLAARRSGPCLLKATFCRTIGTRDAQLTDEWQASRSPSGPLGATPDLLAPFVIPTARTPGLPRTPTATL